MSGAGGFVWHSDGGHAWLVVNYVDYPEALSCATGFGYLDESRALIYLEEDCEAPRFFALRAHSPDNLRVKYYDTDAPCRNLPRNIKHVEPFAVPIGKCVKCFGDDIAVPGYLHQVHGGSFDGTAVRLCLRCVRSWRLLYRGAGNPLPLDAAAVAAWDAVSITEATL